MPSGRYGFFPAVAMILAGIVLAMACGHKALQTAQFAVHVLAGDCVEVTQIHQGKRADAIERFCNALENSTEMRILLIPDGGAGLEAGR